MGMMPSSEWSLRQRKLVPLAARIGCTPERTLGAAGFWAVAIGMMLLSASGAESGAVGYQIEGRRISCNSKCIIRNADRGRQAREAWFYSVDEDRQWQFTDEVDPAW